MRFRNFKLFFLVGLVRSGGICFTPKNRARTQQKKSLVFFGQGNPLAKTCICPENVQKPARLSNHLQSMSLWMSKKEVKGHDYIAVVIYKFDQETDSINNLTTYYTRINHGGHRFDLELMIAAWHKK